MNKIITMLEKEYVDLSKFIVKLESKSNNRPEGYLRIDKNKYKYEYYYVEGKRKNTNHNGRYMKKEEMPLVRAIAQRDYDVIALKKAKERKKCIEDFMKKYDKTDLKDLYNKTHPQRRALIETDIISDEEYVKRWLAVEYKGKGEVEDDIVTERGECVRSKSEKIIADKLSMLDIPYRYEYPLVLNSYENNGIFIGVNLFVTYETSQKPLNTRILNNKLKEIFN